jgi:hypothetical protein
MRRLVAAIVVVSSLVACSQGVETITEVDDGPVRGTYSLRTIDDAPLPLYFWPNWYPGRSTTPGVLSSTIRSAALIIREDGSFLWLTQLDEMVRKPNSTMLEYVFWNVQSEAYGTWSHTASTGAVSLEGVDRENEPYVLKGSSTGTVLTLSSTFPGGPNWTFVLDR